MQIWSQVVGATLVGGWATAMRPIIKAKHRIWTTVSKNSFVYIQLLYMHNYS